ncbi:hypothetical protein BB559_003654 [Furculomyces boomerangus]|uniref:Uncharacterized protein n=1 Tax=Furculomyces boomerangus TaxID=61424 RepID=A0A2T9YJV8_9FUNG|nr:hypothetical protein BB559_003654 [Furculomyces boomerangus]
MDNQHREEQMEEHESPKSAKKYSQNKHKKHKKVLLYLVTKRKSKSEQKAHMKVFGGTRGFEKLIKGSLHEKSENSDDSDISGNFHVYNNPELREVLFPKFIQVSTPDKDKKDVLNLDQQSIKKENNHPEPGASKNLPKGELKPCLCHGDEKSVLSIFNDNEDIFKSATKLKQEKLKALEVLRKNQRKLCFEKATPEFILKKSEFYKDNNFKNLEYYQSLILLIINSVFKDKVDYITKEDEEFHIHKYIEESARLADVSTPYQLFLVWLFKLFRWDNPKNSIFWCLVYFTALFYGKLYSLFFLIPIYLIIYHRIRPTEANLIFGFDNPNLAYIQGPPIQEAGRSLHGKTKVFTSLYDYIQDNPPGDIRIVLSDITDWMEMMKNCIRYMRYRRILWFPEWALWFSETDLQLSVKAHNENSANNKRLSTLVNYPKNTFEMADIIGIPYTSLSYKPKKHLGDSSEKVQKLVESHKKRHKFTRIHKIIKKKNNDTASTKSDNRRFTDAFMYSSFNNNGFGTSITNHKNTASTHSISNIPKDQQKPEQKVYADSMSGSSQNYCTNSSNKSNESLENNSQILNCSDLTTAKTEMPSTRKRIAKRLNKFFHKYTQKGFYQDSISSKSIKGYYAPNMVHSVTNNKDIPKSLNVPHENQQSFEPRNYTQSENGNPKNTYSNFINKSDGPIGNGLQASNTPDQVSTETEMSPQTKYIGKHLNNMFYIDKQRNFDRNSISSNLTTDLFTHERAHSMCSYNDATPLPDDISFEKEQNFKSKSYTQLKDEHTNSFYPDPVNKTFESFDNYSLTSNIPGRVFTETEMLSQREDVSKNKNNIFHKNSQGSFDQESISSNYTTDLHIRKRVHSAFRNKGVSPSFNNMPYAYQPSFELRSYTKSKSEPSQIFYSDSINEKNGPIESISYGSNIYEQTPVKVENPSIRKGIAKHINSMFHRDASKHFDNDPISPKPITGFHVREKAYSVNNLNDIPSPHSGVPFKYQQDHVYQNFSDMCYQPSVHSLDHLEKRQAISEHNINDDSVESSFKHMRNKLRNGKNKGISKLSSVFNIKHKS